MITIFATQNNELKKISVDEFRAAQVQLDFDEAQYWIDLEDPTPEEENLVLKELFCFHRLAILDCQRERLNPERGDHPPKVEDYERYLFVIFNPVDTPRETPDPVPLKKKKTEAINVEFPTRQLNAFLGINYLVTHHYEQSTGIDYVRDLCGRNSHMLDRGPDYVFHIIVDELVDNYGPITEYLDDMLDSLEASIFKNSHDVTLLTILNMKKGIMRLKRITNYQREIMSRLSRGEFELVSDREIFYYRNVYDHLVRASDMIENYRDSIAGLVELYMSVTSNKLNQVMKALTVMSSVFLPLTFIAGVYGMNFENMPELEWHYGYFIVLGVMVLVGIFQVWFFKKKGWLLDL